MSKKLGTIAVGAKQDYTAREALRYVSKPMLALWSILTVVLVLVLSFTAPFRQLIGTSEFSAVGTIHGILATLGVLIGTVVAFLGWRLFWGSLKAYFDLRVLATITSVLSAATIIFGNWIYIAYRASGGPRAYFIKNIPEVHKVFFEFKEFMALFTLPIVVGATYVLWKYRDELPMDRRLRHAVATMIVIGWGFLMITYILGAAVTKLKSV